MASRLADLLFYAFVEDIPSEKAAIKLFNKVNETREQKLIFNPGFPTITRGNQKLREKCPAFLNMARPGTNIFALTDLDRIECAPALIRDWFGIQSDKEILLPTEICFRVAVREVESWILADRIALADFFRISDINFHQSPDNLEDPKEHLLNVIRRRTRRRIYRDMLTTEYSHVGPTYNEVLAEFITVNWDPHRASENSASLEKTIRALENF